MTWREVSGYDGYQVSDNGQVRSRRKVLKPMSRHGKSPRSDHVRVVLYRNGVRTWKPVADIVLEAFVGPRPDGMWALHKDDNALHNAVGNLYWGTPTENAQDRVSNGHDYNASKTHCKRNHPLDDARQSQGRRHCKRCHQIRDAAYRARKKVVL